MNIDYIIFYLTTIVVLLASSRFFVRLLIPTDIKAALIDHDCKSVGIQFAGYLFSILLIVGAAYSGTGYSELWRNIMWTLVYGVSGIFFTIYTGKFLSKFILKGDIEGEILAGNTSVAIASASVLVACALVFAGAVSGDLGGSHLPSLIFFVAGILTLIVVTYVYRALTQYDDVKEIIEGNTAAAISYSSNMIAVGIIVGHAASANYIGMAETFRVYAIALVDILFLYPIRQFVVQGLFLGGGFKLIGGRLDSEIAEDKNIAAAIVEGAAYIGAALLAIKLS